MQWLAALCVRRPVFATVLILSLSVIGGFSFLQLGVDRFPKIEIPTIVVTTVQPVDIAENLKKQQANIPGIRPGKQTAEYLDRVLTRLTVAGAIYIAAICVVPAVIANSFRVPFQFGGTSLMIVVGVALETVNQIEAHLITRSYEGLTGPRMTRLSGRRP